MQVKVDGVVTPLLVNSLKVDNAVGQRSTASVTLVDTNGANHYQDGQRVDITDNSGNLVYSGVVDTDDEVMPDSAVSSNLLFHNVACKDWHYLADKRLVAKAYNAGQTCGAIINDLLTTILADEGVISYRGINLLSANQADVSTDISGFYVGGAQGSGQGPFAGGGDSIS